VTALVTAPPARASASPLPRGGADDRVDPGGSAQEPPLTLCMFPTVGKAASAWARWRDRAAALALTVLLLGVAACTGAEPDPAPTPTLGSSQAGSPSAAPATGVDKVLVIVEENRSVQDAAAHMPFLMSQVRSYGTATNFYAIGHPSLPNYLALAGGSTFGVADDKGPDAHRLQGPSVFGQLVAAGRTAKTYAEAMPTNCARRSHETYAMRHNPWTYFDDRAERATCEQFDVPSGSPTAGALVDDITAGELPTFGLLVPDLCHDGHDCPAATSDDWLRSWLPTIQEGPDFTSNRLAIVVTWDEDDDHSGNRVPMVVIHPSLKGRQVTTRLDHYGLSASIARVGGIPPLREAAKGTDVLAAFGL
jgi:phosphatidylinositol-3-phosphatase